MLKHDKNKVRIHNNLRSSKNALYMYNIHMIEQFDIQFHAVTVAQIC